MSYAKRGFEHRRTNYSQDQKAMYDIRDNVESQAGRINSLTRAVKQLSTDIKDIYSMLEERGHISGNKLERKHTFSHASRDNKSSEVLQASSCSDEGDRVCKDKNRRRLRMDPLYDKGQKVYGRDVKQNVAFDVSPPRRADNSGSEKADKE